MINYMQERSRNLIKILQYADQFYRDVEVVSRKVEDGSIHRCTYSDVYRRTKQFANALKGLGLEFGDRVGTLAWNTYRHLEVWYALAGQGAICHTINPRLFADQIEFIINHASNRFLLVDLDFVPVLESIVEKMPTVEAIIIMTDAAHIPEHSFKQKVYCYEDLIEQNTPDFDWPSFPDSTVSSLCYTSGTTGNPKGVAYTHGSNLIHATCSSQPDVMNISSEQVTLMVVPMFHANSWGLAYSAPMTGSKLVLPGSKLDGASIWELLDKEKVTFSAAVPTVWNLLLTNLESTGQKLPHLKDVVIGGAAVPRSMIETFDKIYGVTVIHVWGMTEMSPIGSLCRLTPAMKEWDYDRQVEQRLMQGRPPFGVEMKIVGENGAELPHDGKAFGSLLVRGPWVVNRYYLADELATDEDGWFDTGDVAVIDQYGFMKITDRAKDVIKSGGEWISSVDLENAAVDHAAVDIAAVIGVPHPKWGERPMLILKLHEGDTLEIAEILEFLSDKVAKWWLPEEVVFVDEIPMTATGKISKLSLRQQFISSN